MQPILLLNFISKNNCNGGELDTATIGSTPEEIQSASTIIKGPPGPPGTPGSDGPLTPPLNLQSNIVCSKDGVCPAGKTKCNDKGQCVENFALISLEEKINLQNKYKDLNHNSYKADKLMNNLEQYLLNTFK